jgi:hypothetical protein
MFAFAPQPSGFPPHAARGFVEDAFLRSLDAPEGVFFARKDAEGIRAGMDIIAGHSVRNLDFMVAPHQTMRDAGRMLSALYRFGDLKIRIMVENDHPFDEENSLLSKLRHDIKIRERTMVGKAAKPSPVHLSVGDSAWVGIHQDENSGTIFAFNNPEIATRAARRFDALWRGCKILPWPQPD